MPFWPHSLMNLPSFVNFTMRSPLLPPWPSPTKMSPFGAKAMAFGSLKVSVAGPATPALPSVISTLPSGENLKTCWPLPSLPWPSVIHTLSSASIADAVRKDEHPAAPIVQDFPILIEFEDRVELGIGARRGDEPFDPAAFDDPDVIVLVDRDRRDRTFEPSLRPLVPVRDFAIWIRRRVDGRAGGHGRFQVGAILSSPAAASFRRRCVLRANAESREREQGDERGEFHRLVLLVTIIPKGRCWR